MKKGFILGVVIAGLLFGVFAANNNFIGQEIIQAATNFCFSVPGYIFAIWLKLPDALSVPLVFAYFGIVGFLFGFLSGERKGRMLFITAFVVILLCAHWFFDMKISEEMSSIGTALKGLAHGVSGQINS